MNPHFNEDVPESMSLCMTEEEAKQQSNPNNYPEGFFRVMNALGRPLGVIGFYCDRCKLSTMRVGRNGIRHCGKVEQRPNGFWEIRKLKEFKVLPTPESLRAALRG